MIETSESIGVEVCITPQLLKGADALHVEAHVELVSHTDAAVHLDRFLNSQSGTGARSCLGGRNQRAGAVDGFVEGLQRPQYHRAGHFQFAVHVCSPMLEGLELSDDLSELLAFL